MASVRRGVGRERGVGKEGERGVASESKGGVVRERKGVRGRGKEKRT